MNNIMNQSINQKLSTCRDHLVKDSSDAIKLLLQRYSYFELQDENAGNFDVTFQFKENKVHL